MSIRNQVQLIGFLGQTPEVKVANNGVKYARLSLATTDRIKNKEGDFVSVTTWHNLTVFDKQVDIAQRFLTKGKEVCINGSLVNNTYTDKDGNKRSGIEVRVKEILLLGSAPKEVNSEATSTEVSISDELPF